MDDRLGFSTLTVIALSDSSLARSPPGRSTARTELVHHYVWATEIAKTRGSLPPHDGETMLEMGADVRHLQALLLHAQLSTTELYTGVSIAQLKAVHERTHSPLARAPSATHVGRARRSGTETLVHSPDP